MDNRTIYDKDIAFSKEVDKVYESINTDFNLRSILDNYVKVTEFKFAIEKGLQNSNPGCNECNLEGDKIIFDDTTKKYELVIETGEWDYYYDSYVTEYMEIDFCPFCGKKL